MRISKLFFSTLLAAILLPVQVQVFAASVSSMTAEQEVGGPGGEVYLQSSVDCASSDGDRLIWKKQSGGEWCSPVVADMCSRKKIIAAKKVCGREFSRLVDEMETAGTAPMDSPEKPAEDNGAPAAGVESSASNKAPLNAAAAPEQSVEETAGARIDEQQRQLEIERERLRIEQQRLELRKQQVELQKQELEIKRQLEAQEKSAAAAKKASSEPAPQEPRNEELPAGSGVKKNVLGM